MVFFDSWVPLNKEVYYPKLYTLLERLDEICPGKLAKLTNRLIKRDSGEREIREQKIIIEGVGYLYDNCSLHPDEGMDIDILEKALVGDKQNNMKEKGQVGFMYMPTTVYNQKCWENRNKTDSDIRNDFSYNES